MRLHYDETAPHFSFQVLHKDLHARVGEIKTSRGSIRTPAFMPVGTVGTVKALYPEQIKESGADIVLANTYHLMLRPGAERISRLGGLHSFMLWDKPILTDSGGFQVMSLSKIRKVTEEGVEFRSHLDGSLYLLTPERSVEIQCLLGSDIMMQFDECIKLPADIKDVERAMELSLQWAIRSKKAFDNNVATGRASKAQSLFGIVQGGTNKKLRKRSAQSLVDMNFQGYAIGGLAVGEGHETMVQTLEDFIELLPQDKPRYLMGVGTPLDIIESVRRGVDMFDCVMPTRNGRHGTAFTWEGKINLHNSKHAEDKRPLDPNSSCPAAKNYSRAYLHHLVKSGEYLGAMILSWANTCFYQDLMKAIRQSIEKNSFDDWSRTAKEKFVGGDTSLISD